ncbi:putative IS605 transposase [Chloropicon primus]|uniref:Putative IS605 transposase n=1 Tax=Chloropicon primus TaxID=1764295 RepID=A0A5B8MNT7_9CHLO|nr:putative IS605 transposase [Chloropicon primus]|eukprot:QDZ21971.1 putative IS605 transposase [Chloropicon primus]
MARSGKRRKKKEKQGSGSTSSTRRSHSGESHAQGASKSGQESPTTERPLRRFWNQALKWLYEKCMLPIADDPASAGEGSSTPRKKRGGKRKEKPLDDPASAFEEGSSTPRKKRGGERKGKQPEADASAGESSSSSGKPRKKPRKKGKKKNKKKGKKKKNKRGKKAGKQPGGLADDSVKKTWFSSMKRELEEVKCPKTGWRSCLNLPEDSVVSVETLQPPAKRKRGQKLKTSKLLSERTVIRTRKVRMRLNPEQAKCLCNWMGAARFTYNKCLEAVKKEGFPLVWTVLLDRFVTAKPRRPEVFEGLEKELKEIQCSPRPWTKQEAELFAAREKRLESQIGGRRFRAEVAKDRDYVSGAFVNQKHPWLTETPCAIRQAAVRSLIKAWDSNIAKQEAMKERGEKKGHRFVLKYRQRQQPSSWTIEIDARELKNVETIERPNTRHKDDTKHKKRRKWTKLEVFKKKMAGGPLYLTEEIPGGKIEGAVKITRNRLGQFHMHIPIATPWDRLPPLKPENKRKVVALDPGVRTFQTSYSPQEGVGEYATGERGFARLFNLCWRIDGIISEREDPKVKLPYLDRRDLKRQQYACMEKLRGLTNELHKKVANDLCRRFDTILLPEFKSQDMVKKNNNGRRRVIRKKTARTLLTLRHYAFRTFLASKVLLHGSELAIVTEEYTSKTCGKCGHIKDNLGGAEVYKCQKCGFKCGRDVNGARNVLLKHLRQPKSV